MLVKKNGKMADVEFPWKAEEKGVGTYEEMLQKVTGTHCPTVRVVRGDVISVDLSGDMAVITHPSIPEGEYKSVPFTEIEGVETYEDWSPATGGFDRWAEPYQPPKKFRWYKDKHKGTVVRDGQKIAIMF